MPKSIPGGSNEVPAAIGTGTRPSRDGTTRRSHSPLDNGP